MKKISIIIITVLLAFIFCACGENSSKSEKTTTAQAAEECVDHALNKWMETKVLSFECTTIDFDVLKTERISTDEDGMMYYYAYGTATFLNDYGDVLAEGKYKVKFGHDGGTRRACTVSETVVELS